MEQHRWSNETCLTWQRWNQLSKEEQEKDNSWNECKEYAQRMRLTRRTDVSEGTGEPRSTSPAMTVQSSRRGRGEAHQRAEKEEVPAARKTETKKNKIKQQRPSPASSPDPVPVRKRSRRRRRGSPSSSPPRRRERTEGRDRRHVVINIA